MLIILVDIFELWSESWKSQMFYQGKSGILVGVLRVETDTIKNS